MASRRPFCADLSWETREPLAATASRIDNWVLIEYRGVWVRDLLDGSLLSDGLKESLSEQLALLPRARLLFIRRPERRNSCGRRVFLARTREHGSTLYGLELDDLEDLRELDLKSALDGGDGARRVTQPLLVVCTHGKRDPCCARYGRPLYEGLRDQAEEGSVWQASHVGGDRFAGNLVVLPDGAYYGRVGPADAWVVVEAALERRVHLPLYRGRSCYGFAAQAAELAVRETTSLLGADEVRILSIARTGAAWRAHVAAAETSYEVDVHVEEGAQTHLTCSTSRLSRPKRYVGEILRARGA